MILSQPADDNQTTLYMGNSSSEKIIKETKTKMISKKIDSGKLYVTLSGSIIAVHKINGPGSQKPGTVDFYMLEYPDSIMNTLIGLAIAHWTELDVNSYYTHYLLKEKQNEKLFLMDSR